MKNALNELFKDAEKYFETIENTYNLLEKSHEKKVSIHAARAMDFG